MVSNELNCAYRKSPMLIRERHEEVRIAEPAAATDEAALRR